MTGIEKKLYEKIKNDPSHFMFDLLFQHDESGNIKPIEGKTLKLMEDGTPMVLNTSTTNSMNRSSFDSITNSKSFREISNKIATKNPFGKKSTFYSQEREIIKGQIPKL